MFKEEFIMKTFEESIDIIKKYVSSAEMTLMEGCSCCCASHGGGKARYQDTVENEIVNIEN